MTVWPGPTNSLLDVAGIGVGHAERSGEGWLTGTTVVLAPEAGATAGVDVRGGGPGTRETDLLDPINMVERVHAVVLTGGSAYGLAAADGVMTACEADGRGFAVGATPTEVVPIVPAAVIFDLGRGGEFIARPDAGFGRDAYAAAVASTAGHGGGHGRGDGEHAPSRRPLMGSIGAGTGAQAGGLKGGVGTASTVLPDGSTVAALVVVNPAGSTVDPATGRFYGAGALLDGDLVAPALQLGDPDPAELAAAHRAASDRAALGLGGAPGVLATTIGVIATDATLTKAQCAKLSGIGHDGLARAIDPVHTMVDGDTLFTVATGAGAAPDPLGFHLLLTHAARCVTRAVVRGMLAADGVDLPGEDGRLRSYREAFGSAVR